MPKTPRYVAAGDFNSDGKPDLVTANSSTSDVTIQLSSGSGNFGTPVNYVVGGNAVSVVVSDVNGDGKMDVVTANQGSYNLSVLINTGIGTFNPTVNYPTGAAPFSVTAGDVNGDGKPDLLAPTPANNNTISVFLNIGSGTFAAPTLFPLPADTFPRMVALGDFNSDGKVDLATANNGIAGTVSVLLGTGTGGFGEPTSYLAGKLPYSVVAGDFNGDNKDDLAVGIQGAGYLSVLLNSGTGTFDPVIQYPTIDNTQTVVIGDFNGDTKPDLATKGILYGHISLFQNSGISGFVPETTFTGGILGLISFATADFNEDGRLDLVFPRSTSLRLRLSCTVSVNPISPAPVCSSSQLSLTATGLGFSPSSYSWSSSPVGFTSSGDSPTFTAPSVSSPTPYTITVTATEGTLIRTTSVTVLVNPSTGITSQPITASTVAAGATVTTSVSATGTGPLSYQWYKNNLSNPVAGQTSATLNMSSVTLADVGSYSVVVTGACNSVTSSDFNLVVVPPDLTPILYALPASQYGTSNFSVVVDLFELNSVPTQGLVTVYITKDPLVNLSFNESSTSVGGKLVQNGSWTFDGVSDENVYILTTKQAVGAGSKTSIGLTGVLSSGNTKGSLTITSTLTNGSGEEIKITNNTDADKVDYFKQ